MNMETQITKLRDLLTVYLLKDQLESISCLNITVNVCDVCIALDVPMKLGVV